MEGKKSGGLKVQQLDLEKRYDIYHYIQNEERLYENVKFVGLRTIEERSSYYGIGVGTYYELETIFGSRLLITAYGVNLICEHGTKPAYKVYRSWLKEA